MKAATSMCSNLIEALRDRIVKHRDPPIYGGPPKSAETKSRSGPLVQVGQLSSKERRVLAAERDNFAMSYAEQIRVELKRPSWLNVGIRSLESQSLPFERLGGGGSFAYDEAWTEVLSRVLIIGTKVSKSHRFETELQKRFR